MLDRSPTTSPTSEGGADFFYPDYETSWSIATCKNELPLPFGPGGRPVYDTMLECCKGAYGSQASGACLAALPSHLVPHRFRGSRRVLPGLYQGLARRRLRQRASLAERPPGVLLRGDVLQRRVRRSDLHEMHVQS